MIATLIEHDALGGALRARPWTAGHRGAGPDGCVRTGKELERADGQRSDDMRCRGAVALELVSMDLGPIRFERPHDGERDIELTRLLQRPLETCRAER